MDRGIRTPRRRPAAALLRATWATAQIALVICACAPSERKRPEKLTLYCTAHIEWCQLMTTEFERETGIQVSMIRKSTGELYAQIWAERRNPKGDVWWAGVGDAHFQAAEMNLTAAYRSPLLEELHPWARDPMGRGEFRTTGVYLGILGISYNTEWLAKKQLPPPQSWQDLLKPIYRGEIQIANPNSSGTAYTAMATIVQLFGEEAGFAYLRKLHRNINQYTRSGSAPTSAAARGETGIAISFTHDAMTQKMAGFPLEIVVPREGTGFEIGCVSLIHGARHPEAAKKFLDWSLTARAQELGARALAYQFPSNRNAAIPPEALRIDRKQLIDFDFQRFGSSAVRKHLLARWDAEVKTAPQ